MKNLKNQNQIATNRNLNRTVMNQDQNKIAIKTKNKQMYKKNNKNFVKTMRTAKKVIWVFRYKKINNKNSYFNLVTSCNFP